MAFNFAIAVAMIGFAFYARFASRRWEGGREIRTILRLKLAK